MKISDFGLCGLVRRLCYRPAPDEGLAGKPPTGSIVQNFQQQYSQFKSDHIRNFFSGTDDKDETRTLFLTGYFSSNGTINSPSCYIHENFNLIKANGRRFTVTTVGISDLENTCISLTRIEDFPAREEDIKGYAILISEILDDWNMSASGVSLNTTIPTEQDRLFAEDMLTQIIEEVNAAAREDRPYTDVIDRLERGKYKDLIVRRYNF